MNPETMTLEEYFALPDNWKLDEAHAFFGVEKDFRHDHIGEYHDTAFYTSFWCSRMAYAMTRCERNVSVPALLSFRETQHDWYLNCAMRAIRVWSRLNQRVPLVRWLMEEFNVNLTEQYRLFTFGVYGNLLNKKTCPMGIDISKVYTDVPILRGVNDKNIACRVVCDYDNGSLLLDGHTYLPAEAVRIQETVLVGTDEKFFIKSERDTHSANLTRYSSSGLCCYVANMPDAIRVATNYLKTQRTKRKGETNG